MARLVSHLKAIAGATPEAGSKALLATAKDIYEISQQLVPVDTSSLKRSGGVEVQDSTSVQVGYGSPGEFIKGRDPATYAPFVEYGTSKMGAQPYFTPAFLQGQATFHARLLEEVKKINGVS